ncbi:hypothetical protein ACEUAG_21630 [Aeromonas hydrophila]|uniref:hypothetical protein n=1 Tax=Aeromonas hydrophila TaxID=644 RepID=UPI0038D042A4
MKYLASALLLAPSLSFAGTAIIPDFYTLEQVGQTCIKISNISGEPAQVSVKIYGKNGENFNGTFVPWNIIPSLNTPFVLEPRKTAHFCLRDAQKITPGYGVIDSQPLDGSTGQVFVVASGYYGSASKDYSMGFLIPINGGLPF